MAAFRCGTSRFSPEFYQHKLFKPENNAGCGCNCRDCDKDDESAQTVVRGCFTRYNACGGVTYNACSAISYKACC